MSAPWVAELGSRELFPDLEVRAYLNHAAISPVNAASRAAVGRALDDYARFGALAFPRWEERRQLLRQELATLLGASASEIAFGWNTSRGLSDVALAIPWREGDRIVLFQGEFPANITPWQQAAKLFGLQTVFLPLQAFAHPTTATEQGLTLLEQELRRGVRLVAVSAVQFQSGLRMPLREIGELCQRYSAELCVDAIQACGAVPLDVRACHIDYLACGGHKWLLGVEGAGFVYVNQERVRKLRPYTAGWLSHEDAVDFLFKGAGHLKYDRALRQSADVFETGSGSLLGLAALGASLPLLNALGPERIFLHVNAFLDRLERGLLERGFVSLRAPELAQRSCILSVSLPPAVDLAALAAGLRQRGVLVGTPDGYLRFAPHFANALAEVDHVLSALDACLAKLTGT